VTGLWAGVAAAMSALPVAGVIALAVAVAASHRDGRTRP
jgi:hypothetical protein